jgi:hypothetical protein
LPRPSRAIAQAAHQSSPPGTKPEAVEATRGTDRSTSIPRLSEHSDTSQPDDQLWNVSRRRTSSSSCCSKA